MELAERMVGRHDQKALADSVASDRFVRATSDERFAITFAALAPRKPKVPRPTTWTDNDGKKIVKIERHADRVTLALDEKAAPAFGDFVISRLPELYRAFREGRTDE
jgi:ParB family chromosome partitioning protein